MKMNLESPIAALSDYLMLRIRCRSVISFLDRAILKCFFFQVIEKYIHTVVGHSINTSL